MTRIEQGTAASGSARALSLLSYLEPSLSHLSGIMDPRTVTADKPLSTFAAAVQPLVESVRAGESLLGALHVESRKSVAAVRSDQRRIARGQSAVAVSIERLFATLELQGKFATAALMADILRGDSEHLQRLSESESQSPELLEFFAILQTLRELQQASDDLAHKIASLPDYPVLQVCTEPDYLKSPEQVLCGAVSITAPPAVPTDVTPLGYAVGCVA